jgi:hypothetical protein
MYGYVYCMINNSMQNLCKIGCINTINKTSHERALELSRNTSCPSLFKVIYDIQVMNPYKYEKIIHDKLDNFRKNKKREFFNCNPYDIIDYFRMENLISTEEDKKDFHTNYFKKI